MVYTEFPELQWLKAQAESGFANNKGWRGKTLQKPGWPSVILNVKTGPVCRDNIRGPLSLFCNISGKSNVAVEKKQVTVLEDFFFITNHDQHYTLEVDTGQRSETFNIHFGEYEADQVLQAMNLTPEKLLDECAFAVPLTRIDLYNKLYHRDVVFNNLVEALKSDTSGKLNEEEKLHDVLRHLLCQDARVKKIAETIPVLKTATRQEIMRRLLNAVDFIYTFHNKDLTLDELAQASCLSKFHFLRLFKIAFQKTPHQFISELKVHQAKKMLKDPKLEIHTIANSLGFNHASSFSRMFYNQSGYYPSQLR
jgi:AraC family transcriptional regulator